MLKKRLIGVVLVKNAWAVQSISYSQYFPLGKPACLVENLDRWGTDEILVLSIDRSQQNQGPDFALLHDLQKLNLSTPLIYGGGIMTLDQALEVVHLGADRICLQSIFTANYKEVIRISEHLGAQAIIATLPLRVNNSRLEYFGYIKSEFSSIPDGLIHSFENKHASEALIIDCRNEGKNAGFDQGILSLFPNRQIPKIVFGGINTVEQMHALYAHENLAAVAIGNFLNYREHAVQNFKESLIHHPLRLAHYEKTFSS